MSCAPDYIYIYIYIFRTVLEMLFFLHDDKKRKLAGTDYREQIMTTSIGRFSQQRKVKVGTDYR